MKHNKTKTLSIKKLKHKVWKVKQKNQNQKTLL